MTCSRDVFSATCISMPVASSLNSWVVAAGGGLLANAGDLGETGPTGIAASVDDACAWAWARPSTPHGAEELTFCSSCSCNGDAAAAGRDLSRARSWRRRRVTEYWREEMCLSRSSQQKGRGAGEQAARRSKVSWR
ncbi:hypothetical protein SEVIR_9G176150v4 [Setaria viridis]